jgi:hypothetical protein
MATARAAGATMPRSSNLTTQKSVGGASAGAGVVAQAADGDRLRRVLDLRPVCVVGVAVHIVDCLTVDPEGVALLEDRLSDPRSCEHAVSRRVEFLQVPDDVVHPMAHGVAEIAALP